MKSITVSLIITLIIFVIGLSSCENDTYKLDKRCIQHPKYFNDFELPEGLIGYNNYENALHCSKKTNRPIAVYFSAFNCEDCRDFERIFLYTKEIKRKLNTNFVFVVLNIDDGRELPKEDQAIVTFMGKERKLKNIGNLNAHLQTIKMFGNPPTLALIDSNEKKISLIHYDNRKDKLFKKLNDAINLLDKR